MEHIEDIIVFSIADRLFCVDLKILDAVLYPSETDDCDVGEGGNAQKINCNGEYLTIADFAGYFGLKFANPADQRKILCLKKHKSKVAFYADTVLELISFGRSVMQPSFTEYTIVNGNGKIYKTEIEERRILMPDFEAVNSLIKSRESKNKSSKQLLPGGIHFNY
jgi:chemotaxis signal transduction protein